MRIGGPVGNKKAVKLKTEEQKKKAYTSYCKWIAGGHSKEAWDYQDGDMTLTHKTMEKYMREQPLDFPTIQRERAQAQSLKVWEEKGMNMMEGRVDKCQPAIYQMFMRNKFGWDKEDRSRADTFQPLVRTLLENWEK